MTEQAAHGKVKAILEGYTLNERAVDNIITWREKRNFFVDKLCIDVDILKKPRSEAGVAKKIRITIEEL
ncbi:MAG: hypothetical protein V3U75_13120 [Methylococcaceae bacterium]